MLRTIGSSLVQNPMLTALCIGLLVAMAGLSFISRPRYL
jgi:hypothetical protein